MSSSNARASASVVVEDLVVEGGDPGSRLHEDISGNVAVHASVAMASRRVNKESGKGHSRLMGTVAATHDRTLL